MQYKLSTKELRALLATDYYKAGFYFTCFIQEFEDLGDYGNIKTLFDDLLQQLGRPPSQQEYVLAGTERAKEFFKPNTGSGEASIHPVWKKWGNEDVTFYWNKELLIAVQSRLARTYPSYMVEYSAIITLKEMYPNFQIGSNNFVDTVFGADIVVASREQDKVFYIHVISNTPTSRKFLKQKAKRKGFCYDVNGNKKFYTRDWSRGHIEMAYDHSTTNHTEDINGNFIMKPEYIKEVVEAGLGSPDADRYTDNCQINTFHYWLIENNVAPIGLSELWAS